jgi:hypothetical protein
MFHIVLRVYALSLFSWVGLALYAQAAGPIQLGVDSLRALFSTQGIEFWVEVERPSAYARRYAQWNEVTAADSALLATYCTLFAQEWAKHTDAWVRATRLRAVAFVRHLVVSGQRRAAMPDEGGNVLYLDIGFGAEAEKYARKVIHHEFFHLAEFGILGTMYPRDRPWQRLNPAGFEYGNGGASAYTDPRFRNRLHPSPGFVSTYATYSDEEDRAEVFAFLYTSHLYPRLAKWVERDEVLARKLDRILRFLQAADPALTPAYFASLHQSSLAAFHTQQLHDSEE